jgi:proteic killer suppression protein
MIRSFRDKEAERIYNREFSKRLPEGIQLNAFRKLRYLGQACALRDLKGNPGMRLEKLRGTREGSYSIRINKQWRICFRWQGNHAYDVEIVDYH